MEIETSGAVKLFFPNPSLVLVYNEALANSLDAGATEVSIKIDISSFDKPESLKIVVSDNGTGFNEESFNRFKTLLKPRDKFHKGIGRLVFLKYFKKVEVDSTWNNENRKFIFKEGFDGLAEARKLNEETPNVTTMTFTDFCNERIKSYNDLKPSSLKISIIEQFLPYLVRLKRENIKFKISISLVTECIKNQNDFFNHDVVITENDLPEFTKITIEDPILDVYSNIDIFYNIKTASKGRCLTAFNIDDRTIPVNLLATSSLPNDYSCIFLFESDLFHSNADSSRQKLILPNGIHEQDLYKKLKREIGKILSSHIPQIEESNLNTKLIFENKFPHLLGYFEQETIGLINKEEALGIAQQKFFNAEKEILQCEELSDSAYEKSLELSSRVLTEYILYREKIIRRMKSMTNDNSETEIHNLIVPRYNIFEGQENTEIYQNNAWLLDDKFMVFRTILSEERMDTVINAIRLDEELQDDPGRPDIAMVFSADPEDSVQVDVVVVEIKKKTDEEKDNQWAINQLLDRAVKLVKHCNNIQRVWYYAVMDVNETMENRLEQMKWVPLYSKGKVFYQEFSTKHPDGRIIPTPTFVMSFDAIVADAESKNHTFLEILREGMKQYR